MVPTLCKLMLGWPEDAHPEDFPEFVDWADNALPHDPEPTAAAWAIIESQLSHPDQKDPTLLAAAWLLMQRPLTADQVERDTGRLLSELLHGPTLTNFPRGRKGARQIIVYHCLLGVPKWERRKHEVAPLNAFKFSQTNGPTPRMTAVAEALEGAAERWFQGRDLLPTQPEPQPEILDAEKAKDVSAGPSPEDAREEVGGGADYARGVSEPRLYDRSSPATSKSDLARSVSSVRRQKRKLPLLQPLVIASVASLLVVVIPSVLRTEGPSSTPTSSPTIQRSEPVGTSNGWLAGWGPERPMFTINNGGSMYPTFNSISDNPNLGDERNFVALKDARNMSPGGWGDDVWGRPGDEFLMRIYVNNSGTDSFGIVKAGWIQGAKLEVGVLGGGNQYSVFGKLTALNAATVWDGATVHVDPGVTVSLEASEATLSNNAHPNNGLQIDPRVTTAGGVLIGYDKMDEEIQPGYQYASYFTVKVVVK
ncbi:hypothetical protein [Arthrobacter woluwensis]|uniref:hypothetical protein n=1 Tax=Arthrobacter woluwensis TaxID=156980 RepID=UPI003820F52A